MAYEVKAIAIHATIKVRMLEKLMEIMKHGIIKTTVGKIIFNESYSSRFRICW